MYREIFNLLDYYVLNEIDPGKKFAEQIIEIFNRSYYKNHSIKEIRFAPINIATSAMLSYTKGIITINSILLRKYPKEQKAISIILCLLHEYIHVIQYENMDRNTARIPSSLIFASFSVFSKANWDDNVHNYIPTERLASLSSIIHLIRILSYNEERYMPLILYYRINFYIHILDGYRYDDANQLSSPIEILLNHTVTSLNINEIKEESKKLSFPERLLHGLPIEAREYNYIYKNYIFRKKEYDDYVEGEMTAKKKAPI